MRCIKVTENIPNKKNNNNNVNMNNSSARPANRAVSANKKPNDVASSTAKKVKSGKKKSTSAKLKQGKAKRKVKKLMVFAMLFFAFAAVYFSWIYAFPIYLKNSISEQAVKEFIHAKFAFNNDFSSMNFYTTPSLDIGLQIKDLKLVYPDFDMDSEQGLFLTSKNTTIEIQAIPFFMKTIKFDKFDFKSVYINLYQDSAGQYAFKEHLLSRFMPRLPLYVIEYPQIKLRSYNFDNFNLQTQQFKKNGGALMTIKPMEVKAFLQDAEGINTTTFK